MSAPHGVTCSRCYYFHPLDPDNNRDGQCHRYAPVPGLLFPGWPTVQPAAWCGEFRHQADAPAALGRAEVPAERRR